MVSNRIDIKRALHVTLVVLFAALLAAPAARAASTDEGALADWLSRYVGARSIGLGGAFVAVGDEASAAVWNPASLARMDQMQVQSEMVKLFEDTSVNLFSFAMPNRSLPSFGVTIMSLSSGGFQRTNELNDPLGEFKEGDVAIHLTGAKRLSPRLALGVNAKVLNMGIEDYSASGFGTDLGMMYTASDAVQFGAALLNVGGPKITLRDTEEKMPSEFRVGGALRFMQGNGLISAEIADRNGYGTEGHVGAEAWLMDKLAVRLGYHSDEVTMGFGTRLPNGLQFDYGYADHELGGTHRFGVSYRFGGFFASSRAVPEVFSPTGLNPVTKFHLIAKTRADAADWQLVIRDKSDQVVRTFGGQGQPPSHVQWDGRNASSMPLPDGKYRYRLIVHDTEGREIVGREYEVEIFTGGPQGSVPVDVD